MERSTRVFSTTVVVLMLLLLVTELGPNVAEARHCESPSHRFKGICVRKSNCAAICQTEGFSSGKCRGFRSRCVCIKHCHHHEEVQN